jgi:hypothetical protein
MSWREQQTELFKDLGVVLERLWNFHQAMRAGRPVQDAEESLAQLRTALTHGSEPVHLPVNFPTRAGAAGSPMA